MNQRREPDYIDQFERTHPLASIAMRQLLDLNRQSKQHVFDAAQQILITPTATNEGQAAAFKALSRWLSETNAVSTSRAAYDKWRATRPYGELSSSSIERAFGSWAEAIDIVTSRPTPNFQSVRRNARGPVFSRMEILDALKAWAEEETARLSTRNYRIWACCESRAKRIPRDTNMIARRFGSFTEALHEAGLTERIEFERTRPNMRARIPETELIQTVQEFLAADRGTGVKAFNKYRADCIAEGHRIPNERTIRERLGDGKWRFVLERVGQPSEHVPGTG